LEDALDRYALALAHPLIADVDAIVVLGDLAHFGDRTSLTGVVDHSATVEPPVLLLSGNHDVLTDGVRLEQIIDAAEPKQVWCPRRLATADALRDVFDDGGVAVDVHEVTGMHRRTQPFDVESHSLIENAARPLLLLTHFPVLSFEQACRDAALLYSAHLAYLSPLPAPPVAGRPTIALSGHLHLRAVATEADTLQISFAALVEAPYEVAAVDVDVAPGQIDVRYECASVREIDRSKLPVLAPASGVWSWSAGSGWRESERA
jgi:hypothetical protein